MTPTIATILALAAVAWALAWWDIQRRKHVEDTRYELLSRGVHDAVSHAKELDARVAELERNPVSMPATKARMDVVEKAMAELVKQTKQALDEQAQRNMTIVTRLDQRRGMRPSG